jgi:phage I-like protein
MQPSQPDHRLDHDHARALNAAADREHAVRAFCLQLPASDAAPEWIPYLPAPDASGRIVGEDGRTWTVGRVRALAAAQKRKLPVDINHSTELAARQGGESPAVGWITGIEVRDDGSTWAKVDWNARGSNALLSRDYGFVSPTFDFNKKTGEITALVSAALVNEPNFISLALNRAGASHEETAMLEQILAALGLTPSASADEALRAINALKADKDRALNAAEHPPIDRFVPRADHDAVLQRATNAESQLAEQKRAEVERIVDAEIDAALKAGKITPATKDYHRAICLQDGGLAKFREYIKAAPAVVQDGGTGSEAPPPGGHKALTETQRAVCAQLGVSAEDYLKGLNARSVAA